MLPIASSARRTSRLLLTAALSCVLMLGVGCGDSSDNADDASSSANNQPETGDGPSLTGALKNTQDQARNLTDRIAERSEQTLNSFSTDVRDAVEQAEQQGTELADETRQNLVEQAEEIYEQAKSFIQNNRTDLAEQAAEQLQSMKAQLPQSWQDRIDQLQREIDEMVGSGNEES